MVDFDKDRDANLSAFERTGGAANGGLTVRDYFAAAALQGLLGNGSLRGEMEHFVADAWGFAELMMQGRFNAPVKPTPSVEEAFGLDK